MDFFKKIRDKISKFKDALHSFFPKRYPVLKEEMKILNHINKKIPLPKNSLPMQTGDNMKEAAYLNEPVSLNTKDLGAYLLKNYTAKSEFRKRLMLIIKTAKEKLGEYSQERAEGEKKNNPIWHLRWKEIRRLEALLEEKYSVDDIHHKGDYYSDSHLYSQCTDIVNNTESPFGSYFNGENYLYSELSKLLNNFSKKKLGANINLWYVAKYQELSKQDKIQGLINQKEDLDVEVEKLKKENVELKSPELIKIRDEKIAALEKTVSELQSKLETQKREYDEKIDFIIEENLKEINELRETIDSLKVTIKSMEKNHAEEIKKIKEDHKKEISDIKEALTQMFTEIKTVRDEVKTLTSEVDVLKKNNDVKTDQIKKLSNEKGQMQDIIDEMNVESNLIKNGSMNAAPNSFFWSKSKDRIIHQENALCCPLSQCLMEKAVTADDGHTYDEKWLLEYFKKFQFSNNPMISPVTKQKMGKYYVPNRKIQSLIDDFKLNPQNNQAQSSTTTTTSTTTSNPTP